MNEQMYLLIAKALSNEATGDELRELQIWLDADAGNMAIYKEIEQLWASTDELLPQPQFEVSPAWDKVAAKTVNLTTEQPASKTIAFPAWMKLSAAAALLIAAFIGYRFLNAGPDEVVVMAAEETRTVELPDHSIVTLKKGSTLKYPAPFAANERHVTLEGDAFFEVTHNEQQPFIISAKPVDVRVLGTSFNVHCNDATASVVVATGKVQVTASEHPGKKVVLLPGKGVVYKNEQLQETADTNIAYYKTGKLTFSDKPLADAVQMISKVKDTLVQLDPALPADIKQQLINDSFSGSLKTMLTDLCTYSKGITWVRKEHYYLITTR